MSRRTSARRVEKKRKENTPPVAYRQRDARVRETARARREAGLAPLSPSNFLDELVRPLDDDEIVNRDEPTSGEPGAAS